MPFFLGHQGEEENANSKRTSLNNAHHGGSGKESCGCKNQRGIMVCHMKPYTVTSINNVHDVTYQPCLRHRELKTTLSALFSADVKNYRPTPTSSRGAFLFVFWRRRDSLFPQLKTGLARTIHRTFRPTILR